MWNSFFVLIFLSFNRRYFTSSFAGLSVEKRSTISSANMLTWRSEARLNATTWEQEAPIYFPPGSLPPWMLLFLLYRSPVRRRPSILLCLFGWAPCSLFKAPHGNNGGAVVLLVQISGLWLGSWHCSENRPSFPQELETRWPWSGVSSLLPIKENSYSKPFQFWMESLLAFSAFAKRCFWCAERCAILDVWTINPSGHHEIGTPLQLKLLQQYH